MRYIVALLACATACATTEVDDGDEAGFVDGKADGPSAAVIAKAKLFAEGFDFDSGSDEIDRSEAPATGPTAVRNAFLLHRTWEDNDLGAARLFRWRVSSYRVWAVRTSTDGDDSFIELFDGAGAAFASGVGGFTDDGHGGFKPTITWDTTVGAVRDRFAPRDVSADVEHFWASLDAAASPTSTSGTHVSRTELVVAIEELLGGTPTTRSIDGWESAALYRALADRHLSLSYDGRTLAHDIAGFYRAPFVPLSSITRPSIKTLMGLPTTLSTKIKVARTTRPAADVGMPVMNQLAQKLAILPASALPATPTELRDRLVAAGATKDQAIAALTAIGADAAKARIFRGSAFTSDPSGRATQVPGTTWFVDSPAKTFVVVLHVVADANELLTWQTRALATVEQLTGARQDASLVQLRPRSRGAIADLEFARPEGVLSIAITLGNGEPAVSLRAVSPNLDPELRDSIAALIGGSADVLAVAPHGNAYDVVFRAGSALPKLARVDFAASTVTSILPSTLDAAAQRALALSAAQHHAEQLVAEQSATAQLEVMLRTAWKTPADLEAVSAEDSAVGFDTATELSQFMLGSVWGDNAVFVTFRKNGTVRVEDFN